MGFLMLSSAHYIVGYAGPLYVTHGSQNARYWVLLEKHVEIMYCSGHGYLEARLLWLLLYAQLGICLIAVFSFTSFSRGGDFNQMCEMVLIVDLM